MELLHFVLARALDAHVVVRAVEHEWRHRCDRSRRECGRQVLLTASIEVKRAGGEACRCVGDVAGDDLGGLRPRVAQRVLAEAVDL